MNEITSTSNLASKEGHNVLALNITVLFIICSVICLSDVKVNELNVAIHFNRKKKVQFCGGFEYILFHFTVTVFIPQVAMTPSLAIV